MIRAAAAVRALMSEFSPVYAPSLYLSRHTWRRLTAILDSNRYWVQLTQCLTRHPHRSISYISLLYSDSRNQFVTQVTHVRQFWIPKDTEYNLLGASQDILTGISLLYSDSRNQFVTQVTRSQSPNSHDKLANLWHGSNAPGSTKLAFLILRRGYNVGMGGSGISAIDLFDSASAPLGMAFRPVIPTNQGVK